MAVHKINVGCAFCTPVPFVDGPAGPRLAMVTTEWTRAKSCLVMPTNFSSLNVVVDGMEVGMARDKCARDVMALPKEKRPEFIFFLDYDVIPQFDAFQKLIFRARHFPDHDIFAGVYCSKTDLSEPLIYKDFGVGPYWDWAIGDILSEGIVGVHMGLTLIRTSLFEKLPWSYDKPWFKTERGAELRDDGLYTAGGTEDLYFTKRCVEELGTKILVDTSVLAGHIDHSTGRIFGLRPDSLPYLKAKWRSGGEEYKAEKKCLDLGAGEHKRDQWPGYKVYSTDIREGLGVDYVMDTRLLNFPKDHWDMLASSHHLEHIGRWDQAAVWAEMFRVTKPGGTFEHIVPSVEWAAAKIMDGEMDEHVQNVLYGAQEEHGYKREFNTHFFGYSKLQAEALAVLAGYVDVTCEDYRDRPELGYNLIIRGRKPTAEEVTPPETKVEIDEWTVLPDSSDLWEVVEETSDSISQTTGLTEIVYGGPENRIEPFVADTGLSHAESNGHV